MKTCILDLHSELPFSIKNSVGVIGKGQRIRPRSINQVVGNVVYFANHYGDKIFVFTEVEFCKLYVVEISFEQKIKELVEFIEEYNDFFDDKVELINAAFL